MACENEDRPAVARAEKYDLLTSALAGQGLGWTDLQLFLRALKQERILEVWARNGREEPFRLLRTYPFCAASGELGPKRQEGDRQVPEGFYQIDRFNFRSKFYLSLGLNYPNASDRKLGDPERPGGDIFIHGGCASTGCIAITDDKIKELFLLATGARQAGQSRIDVHVFPARLEEKAIPQLIREDPARERFRHFWENLRTGFELFEKDRIPPKVTVDQAGRYFYSGSAE